MRYGEVSKQVYTEVHCRNTALDEGVYTGVMPKTGCTPLTIRSIDSHTRSQTHIRIPRTVFRADLYIVRKP